MVFVVVLYGAWLLTLAVFQERLIFPGMTMRTADDALPRPDFVERFWIETPEGTRTEAWFIPGRGITPTTPGPLVVFSHGNAERIDDYPYLLTPYTEWGFSILLVEFRGFGRSTGTPGQAALTADIVAAFDRVVARPEVDASRVLLHGRSIGGAVIAQLAARRPSAAMILESSFTNLGSFAWRYGAPPLLLRHPFRTDRVVATYDRPLLLFHGTRDSIVPLSHARKLHRLAPQSKLITADAGHNDFPPDEQSYWREIEQFLR
ncbi:MAG: alpha/beta hydrolase, partial [Planctomycetota bacterium]